MMLFVCQLDERDHLSWVPNLFLSLIINYHEILSNQITRLGFFICLEGGLKLLVNLSTKCLHYQWAESESSSKPIVLKQIWTKYWLMWQKGIWLVGLGLSWTTTKSLVCNAYYAWFGKPGMKWDAERANHLNLFGSEIVQDFLLVLLSKLCWLKPFLVSNIGSPKRYCHNVCIY